jgi:hypothetical protein
VLKIKNSTEEQVRTNANAKCNDTVRNFCGDFLGDARRYHAAMLNDMSGHLAELGEVSIFDDAIFNFTFKFVKRASVVNSYDDELPASLLIAGLLDHADRKGNKEVSELPYMSALLLVNSAMSRYTNCKESHYGWGHFQINHRLRPRLDLYFFAMRLTDYGCKAAERGRSKVDYPDFVENPPLLKNGITLPFGDACKKLCLAEPE